MLYPCICNVVISRWKSGAYDFVICRGGTDMRFVPGSGWKHLDLEQYRISGLTEINGNTFYTITQDEKSTNENSGVRFDDAINNKQKVTYYGYIEEIWELDYGPEFKVPLFWCKWFNLTGVKVDT